MPLRLISRKLFFSVLATVLFLSSCKKDHDAPIPGKDPDPVTQKKITKLYQDVNNFIEFEYTTDGRLWKIRNADEETPGGVQSLEIFYNQNKRIESIFTGDGYRIAYRYEDGKLIATEIKDDKGYIFASGAFYYQNGNLVDYGYFQPYPLEDGNEGTLYKRVRESKYTYNTDKTIATISTNLLNPLNNRLESAGYRKYDKYDGKINPLKELGDFAYGFFQELNPSNVTKELAYNAAGQLEETIERTFTYDKAGYPLTCSEKSTETGKPAITKIFTFSYK